MSSSISPKIKELVFCLGAYVKLSKIDTNADKVEEGFAPASLEQDVGAQTVRLD